jgi:Fe2+ or Zn2+ uptake regulation protein
MNCNKSCDPPEVESFLRKLGLRMTRLKRAVVALFLRGGCGLCASEVHDAVGSEHHLSSVYRCLAVLADAGFLRVSRSADGVYRYRLAGSYDDGHDHFRCRRCGRTIRVDPDQHGTVRRKLEKAYGFRIESMDVHMDGICPGCLGSSE